MVKMNIHEHMNASYTFQPLMGFWLHTKGARRRKRAEAGVSKGLKSENLIKLLNILQSKEG